MWLLSDWLHLRGSMVQTVPQYMMDFGIFFFLPVARKVHFDIRNKREKRNIGLQEE